MSLKSFVGAASLATNRIKPIFSANQAEARRNVLKAYKLWMKDMAFFIHLYELDRRPYEIRVAFKRLWLKNAHLKDPRAIDRLVNTAVTNYWEVSDTVLPKNSIENMLFTDHVQYKPTDFLSKFFLGKE